MLNILVVFLGRIETQKLKAKHNKRTLKI